MLTGSIVSSLQGVPRSTHDIDIVILIRSNQVQDFVRDFPREAFYVDEQSVYEAIEKLDMFQIIDIASGMKIDFWLLTDSSFDRSRFSRRCSVDFMEIELVVSSPEDTILAKLQWAKRMGGSEKQFLDALGVFELQGATLNIKYLERWAEKLDLVDLWRRLVESAEPFE